MTDKKKEKSCAACGEKESENLDPGTGKQQPLRQNPQNPQEWLCAHCPDDPEE